nr:hypothetical protein [Tanacetum cinerariifolium]
MGKTIGKLHALLIEYEKGNGKGNVNGKDKSYIPKPKNPKPSAKEHPTKDDAYHHYKEGLRLERKRKQGALNLCMGNGVCAQVEAIRIDDLLLPNGLVICLDNCHYAHTITRGPVLVSLLVDNGFIQCFTNYEISVSKNYVLYYNAIPSDVSRRAEELKEIHDKDTSPSKNTSKIPMEVEGFKPPQEEVVPIRRSARTQQAPDCLCLNVEVEEYSLGDLNKPANYKAELLDLKSNKSVDAMNEEMQSMKDNQVWCLVDLPLIKLV